MRAKRLIGIVLLIMGVVILSYHPVYSQIDLRAISSLDRVLNPMNGSIKGTRSVKIHCARNEVESFQVVVTADHQQLENVQIEMTGLTSAGHNTISSDHIHLYREIYVFVHQSSPKATLAPGLFPDALVPFMNPYTGQPTHGGRFLPQGFNLWAGHHQPVWVDITVPKDARPGQYTGKIIVKAANAQAVSIPVELTVWNFTLPDGPSLHNHFGGFSRLSAYYGTGKNPERFKTIEMRYIDMLANHRINPLLPTDLMPSHRADGTIIVSEEFDHAFTGFITKYHVTDIEIPDAPYRYPLDRQREQTMNFYRSWYQYLTQKGWENRAYLYMFDEPNSEAQYRQVRDLGAMVKQAVPNLRRLVVEQPYTQNSSWGNLDAAVDIWCPLFGFIYAPSIQRVKQQGDEVWSYTALVQNAPSYDPGYAKVQNEDPPYWEMDFPVTSYRVSSWLNRRYGITGLLYWTTIQWASDPDRNVWDNPAFGHGGSFNGGGQLLYPGDEAGIEGPVASIRLKVLRDAMEDYEYFSLLDKQGREAFVDSVVEEVVPTWGSWKQSPEIYREMRKKLGEAISAKQ